MKDKIQPKRPVQAFIYKDIKDIEIWLGDHILTGINLMIKNEASIASKIDTVYLYICEWIKKETYFVWSVFRIEKISDDGSFKLKDLTAVYKELWRVAEGLGYKPVDPAIPKKIKDLRDHQYELFARD